LRRLRIPNDVAALIRGLHPDIRRKIRAAFAGMLESPEAGKQLRNELSGLRSVRVGRLRIVYRCAARNVIGVIAVGPRSIIYEETLRLIRVRRARE
jgi:mRNA interferase RelE/StbE